MEVSPVCNLLMSSVSLSLLLACTLRALKLSVMSKEGLLRVSKTAPFRCLVNNKNKIHVRVIIVQCNLSIMELEMSNVWVPVLQLRPC